MIFPPEGLQIDFTVRRGCDFVKVIQLLQLDGTPVNTTGMSITSIIRAAGYDDLAFEYTLATGVLTLKLSDTNTLSMGADHWGYSVNLIDSAGRIFDEMYGSIGLLPEAP